jgi:hypothetical protein
MSQGTVHKIPINGYAQNDDRTAQFRMELMAVFGVEIQTTGLSVYFAETHMRDQLAKKPASNQCRNTGGSPCQ